MSVNQLDGSQRLKLYEWLKALVQDGVTPSAGPELSRRATGALGFYVPTSAVMRVLRDAGWKTPIGAVRAGNGGSNRLAVERTLDRLHELEIRVADLSAILAELRDWTGYTVAQREGETHK